MASEIPTPDLLSNMTVERLFPQDPARFSHEERLESAIKAGIISPEARGKGKEWFYKTVDPGEIGRHDNHLYDPYTSKRLPKQIVVTPEVIPPKPVFRNVKPPLRKQWLPHPQILEGMTPEDRTVAERQGAIRKWIDKGGGDPSLYDERKYGSPTVPVTIEGKTYKPGPHPPRTWPPKKGDLMTL